MNLNSAKEIVYLLQNRILSLANKSDRKCLSDIREWAFHCKYSITDIKYCLNKLEDYLLYHKISFDKDFKDLESLRYEGIDVAHITNTIESISTKVSSLEIKCIEEKGRNEYTKKEESRS